MWSTSALLKVLVVDSGCGREAVLFYAIRSAYGKLIEIPACGNNGAEIGFVHNGLFYNHLAIPYYVSIAVSGWRRLRSEEAGT